MRYLPLLLLCAAFAAQAQVPGQVVASGIVADEASKTAVLAKLREVYGADKVLDQITIGQVTTPANWSDYVQKLITPELKQVSRGQLKIDGTSVSVRGEVANEAQRQRIASDFATTACASPPRTRACSIARWPTGSWNSKAARRC
jgi:OOP family OmpA-OmpF porin